jgi:hypothetical protein
LLGSYFAGPGELSIARSVFLLALPISILGDLVYITLGVGQYSPGPGPEGIFDLFFSWLLFCSASHLKEIMPWISFLSDFLKLASDILLFLIDSFKL